MTSFKKKRLARPTRLVLAAALVFGGTSVVNAETTSADSMGCYGWFDYVYKSTHDVNFAYYHFLVCRGEAVAPKLQKAPLSQPITPISGGFSGPMAMPVVKNIVPLQP